MDSISKIRLWDATRKINKNDVIASMANMKHQTIEGMNEP